VPYGGNITLDSGNTEEPQNGSRIMGTRTVYQIVVRSELGERFAAAFEGMEIEEKCGQTILTGEVTDQPHLHGILDRINGLGLELVSVECVAREPQHNAANYPPTTDRTN
jgi:outer membrane PBP1 activator LpoA protein